jgi:hypothetical protein
VKIALIPPVPELGIYHSTGIHLLLSHLFVHGRYLEYYRLRRNQGDYLILDNSAHETGVGEADELLLKACKVRAQEVVAPDVLFDERATVERTTRFLKCVSREQSGQYEEARCPKIMLVPQGNTRQEWNRCLQALVQAYQMWMRRSGAMPVMPVIGISKDYDYWRGGLVAVVNDYVRPLYESGDIADVHCLGWSSNLWTLAHLAREFPWLRSTDSAKPHVFAKNHIQLEPGGKVPEYPRRDPDYFTEEFYLDQRLIAGRNVKVFNAAATDCLILKEDDVSAA